MGRRIVLAGLLLSGAGCSPLVEPSIGGHAFQQMAAGADFTCGVLDDQRLVCWGSNAEGQLGIPGPGATRPTLIDADPIEARLVAAGHETACAILRSGSIGCWGALQAHIELVRGLPALTVISMDRVACGLSASGAAWCWLPPVEAARKVFDGPYTDIAVSGDSACGVGVDSLVACWTYDQTGGSALAPVPGNIHFASIAIAPDHGCGVDGPGTVYCWGANNVGQLGDQTATARPTPAPISQFGLPAGTVFREVVVTSEGSCAIATTSLAYCWGRAPLAALTNFPFRFATNRQWRKLFKATGAHICGLEESQQFYCWGDNSSGQLGVGSTNQVPAPVVVTP